jgi:hypothetical protein
MRFNEETLKLIKACSEVELPKEFLVHPMTNPHWFTYNQSDFTNSLYGIVEAKTDSNMLNIRKQHFKKIEFRGIIGSIINQDPLKPSYTVTTLFDTLHFVKELNLVNQMMIYSDIIEPQYYGGSQLQVLHTLTLSKDTPPTIDSPHYVRVNKSSITSINIRICDRTGEPIKFSDQFSNVLVKLHFRKKMNVYRGSYQQRGFGLGGTFAKFFKWVLPLVRPALAHVGSRAVDMASYIADDVSVGKTFKESAGTHINTALTTAKESIEKKLKGGKRKRKTKVKFSKKRDIFD